MMAYLTGFRLARGCARAVKVALFWITAESDGLSVLWIRKQG
jgi:hypothetical protein